jgi:uncharacterized protein YbjT (DUF2867 family)
VILVTGAAGLSGSIIVRDFARRKAKVRALVRNRENTCELAARSMIEVVEGDMLRPETLGAALTDVERVLMISSSTSQMVETQCTFIDACKKAGVRHIVKFSGAEAGVDREKFRFMRMHDEIERYLESSGLAWTHLRPSQFMQMYFREAPTIVTRNAIFLPMENARLEPVDIEDIAKVAFALLHSEGHEGKSYDMTGPDSLTIAEIAERISSVIGKAVHYVNVSPEEKRKALLANGVPPFVADGIDELFAERRRRPAQPVFLRTHELFGVRPTTFAEFALRNAAVFHGQPDAVLAMR